MIMTKGCVAIGNDMYWEGILIPSDANFDSAGVEIRNYLKYQKDLYGFANALLRHQTWTSFREEHVGCKDPFSGVHTIRFTTENANPLFIEYVYIIDPATKKLHRLDTKIHEGRCVFNLLPDTIDLTEDDPPLLKLKPEDILDLKFLKEEEGFKHGSTIRHYLVNLFRTFWRKQTDFNVKKPFGKGGWNVDLYVALVRNGVVQGRLDDYGSITNLDETAAFDIILESIECLIRGD